MKKRILPILTASVISLLTFSANAGVITAPYDGDFRDQNNYNRNVNVKNHNVKKHPNYKNDHNKKNKYNRGKKGQTRVIIIEKNRPAPYRDRYRKKPQRHYNPPRPGIEIKINLPAKRR